VKIFAGIIVRRLVCCLLALSMLFAVAACTSEPPSDEDETTVATTTNTTEPVTTVTETPDEAPVTEPATVTMPVLTRPPVTEPVVTEPIPYSERFTGKIAIVTNNFDQYEEEYRSAQAVQLKYGADKIIHRTWPADFANEGEQMTAVLQQLAADPEIRAIIINRAVTNTNAAVDRFFAARDDVYIIYCTPSENPPDASARANLIISTDELGMGETMVTHAKDLGAEVFVHYSFPRHMSEPILAERRDLLRETCEREGIQFMDMTAPDPMSDAGVSGARQFILEDVPRQVAEYGKNTAFFSTDCNIQDSLITSVVDQGAIYPRPCCLSPYHGFPTALGVQYLAPTGEYGADGNEIMQFRDLGEVIDETRNTLTDRGMAGRISNWPVSASVMWTDICTEYAVKWINAEVRMSGVDYDAFGALCEEYISEVTGIDGIGVNIQPLKFEGKTYPNYIVGLMDYITY